MIRHTKNKKLMVTLSLQNYITPFVSLCPFLLEKAMATHSSTLGWKIPGTGEPGGLLWGHTESDMTEVT